VNVIGLTRGNEVVELECELIDALQGL